MRLPGQGWDDRVVVCRRAQSTHKLTKESLRAALRDRTTCHRCAKRIKDTYRANAKFLHLAQHLGSMAATQTYYSVERGMHTWLYCHWRSGCVLRIEEEDPPRLLYYLTKPTLDAKPEDNTFDRSKTSVARLLKFCLMAFKSPPRSQDWIRNVKDRVLEWYVDHADFWIDTPAKVRDAREKADKADRSYRAPIMLFTDRSPYVTRNTKPQKSSSGCKAPLSRFKEDPDDSDLGPKGHDNIASPRKSLPTKIPQGQSR